MIRRTRNCLEPRVVPAFLFLEATRRFLTRPPTKQKRSQVTRVLGLLVLDLRSLHRSETPNPTRWDFTALYEFLGFHMKGAKSSTFIGGAKEQPSLTPTRIGLAGHH